MKRESLQKTKYWVTAVFLAVITCLIAHGQSFAQDYTATITSLGCPDGVKPNALFTCNPVISTNIPEAQQVGRTITWMGSDISNTLSASWVDGTPSELVTNADGTLSFPTAGVKNVLLTVTYPQAGESPVTVRRVTTMQVKISSARTHKGGGKPSFGA